MGLLAALRAGASEQRSPPVALDQYMRRVWLTGDGLPQDSVSAIAQTPDGYLWLGSEAGLIRFDGFQFTVFDTSNTPLLPGQSISALLVDRSENLWIGTRGNGLACYRDGRFTTPWKDRFKSETIRAIYQDKAGAVWIGTEGSGLFRLFRSEIQHFGEKEGLAASSVYSIASDRSDNLWLETHHGLGLLAHGSRRISAILFPQGGDDIRSLCIDPEDVVWVGTRNGLFSRPAGANQPFREVPSLKGSMVVSILADRSNALWVGTIDGGLRRLFAGKIVDDDTVRSVVALFQDAYGTVWAGTLGNGLLSFRRGPVTPLTSSQGLVGDVSLGIYQDRRGFMWIGSDSGLTRWKSGDVTRFTKNDGLPDNLVFSITEDGGGTVWVGTRKGLAFLEGGRFHPVSRIEGLPAHGAVTVNFTDLDGSLWVGFRGGIAHHQGNRWTVIPTLPGMSDRLVTSIARDSRKGLWAGTDGGGLFEISESDTPSRRFTAQDGLPSNVVYTVVPDSDGSLWLGTDNGISRFSSGIFGNLSKASGLIDNVIFQLIDDRLGNLWVSSDRGIQQVRKMDISRYLTSHRPFLSSRFFNVSDGMRSRECNGDFQPAGWRAGDGHLWFPTMKGVVSIDPKKALATPGVVTPLLETVLLGEKRVSQLDRLTIPADELRVEFHFTAPGAPAPEKIDFSYRLEGFDPDWVNVGARRIGYYTNLPPGKFHFRIRACVYDACAENAAPLAVFVESAFYETYWFDGLVLVCLGGIGFGANRVHVRHLRRSKQMLKRMVDERTSELRESHANLEHRVTERTQELSIEVEVRKTAELKAKAANQAKSEFLNNISHEIRTPINGIMGMTDLALNSHPSEKQARYLEIVKTSADDLLRIVNDILDFSNIEARKLGLQSVPFRLAEVLENLERLLSPLATRKSLSFHFSVAPEVPPALTGDPVRLQQILRNLLENAVKFTRQGGLSLAVFVDSLSGAFCVLRFAVTDSGIGVAKEKQSSIFEAFSQADGSLTRKFGGTGLGLTICSQLVELMNGSIQVESQEGIGSTFSFTAKFGLGQL